MSSALTTFPVKRFSIVFFPLFLLFLLVFFILIESESKHEIKYRTIEQHHVLMLFREIIHRRMNEIRSDIMSLANHEELSQFFQSEERGKLDSFAHEVARFIEIKGVYDKARFLDLYGWEKMRVNKNGGKAAIVLEEELQDKGDRYYFREAIKLEEGNLYISRFDLNLEKGEIEVPYKPMIRVVTPVFDDNNEKRGLFVLNYEGKNLLSNMDVLFKDKISVPLLLNREGYFLKGLKAGDEWGFMFSNGRGKTFDSFYPEAWKEISRQDSGNYLDRKGLFTYDTIRFPVVSTQWDMRIDSAVAPRRVIEWKLLSFIPNEKLGLTRSHVIVRHSSVPIFLTPVLFILSWMLAVAMEKKRQQEEKQLEAQKILQTVLDTLPERVFWKDKDLNYLGCNRAFAEIAGLDHPGQIVGKNDFDMPWLKEADRYRSDDLEIITDGTQMLNFEEPQTIRKGEKRWLETSKIPLVDIRGRISGVLGTSRDITEKKIRDSQTAFFKDNLIDLLQTPFISLQSNFSIITKVASISLHVERTSIWLYDDEKTAIICQDIYLREKDIHEKGTILYACDFPAYFRALERNRPIIAHDAVVHKDTCEFSEVYLKPNGITSMLDVPIWHKGIIRGVICCEHKGKKRTWREEESDFLVSLAFIVAQTMDAQEREALTERRTELIAELEYANKELSDFAYIVSHDLKAPLRGIAALAGWLSADYADKIDEEGKEHLNLLTGRVERMNSLINGILMYSRAGRSKTVNEDIDLNRVLKEVADSLSPPENIRIDLKGPFPVINCDWARIVQVFQNLLSNAVKYMDKEDGIITVECREEDDHWLFSVTDNGPGIEEKYFERIFHIFQTLSPRDDVESTGVGLTLVKKTVELYNGRVWVESKPGKGSTFYFTLPFSMKPENGAPK